jgi:hypothetical protein
LVPQREALACSHCEYYYRGNQFPEATIKATTDKAALRSLAVPKDVAEQIRTLVLSESITGQNIVMDCGIAI